MKRLFLGVLLAASLVATLAAIGVQTAHADTSNPDFGSVIAAIDLTQQTDATLTSLPGVVEGDISLVNVSPLLPPNPILPPSPIRAFHEAVARNAVDILTLRTTLTTLNILEQPDCADCTLGTLDGYLSEHGIALTDVVTVQLSSAANLSGAAQFIVYYIPTEPCVQNPLSACDEPGIS